jgi:hypothetical protein
VTTIQQLECPGVAVARQAVDEHNITHNVVRHDVESVRDRVPQRIHTLFHE